MLYFLTRRSDFRTKTWRNLIEILFTTHLPATKFPSFPKKSHNISLEHSIGQYLLKWHKCWANNSYIWRQSLYLIGLSIEAVLVLHSFLLSLCSYTIDWILGLKDLKKINFFIVVHVGLMVWLKRVDVDYNVVLILLIFFINQVPTD